MELGRVNILKITGRDLDTAVIDPNVDAVILAGRIIAERFHLIKISHIGRKAVHRSSCAATLRVASSLLAIRTRDPALGKAWASALPKPWLPPVMTTTLFPRSILSHLDFYS